MQIRWSTSRRAGKTYRYAQLVESYRRPKDGMPAKRVVGNLGPLSDDEFANLKAALAASRAGRKVAVSSVQAAPMKPQANLEYLDIAVLLELWRRHGIDSLCARLLPAGEATVRPADVVAALAIHRCVDPQSKLQATHWFGRTALPELLDVDPEAFGNTRLHRVLAQVAEQTGAIMRAMPGLYRRDPGVPALSVLYVDITDATFEGAGPQLACRGRAKDDVIRQRIGIVLVCDQRGYPLRWEAIAGNAPEAPALLRHMIISAGTTWGKNVPVIADRAVGKTAYLRQLLAADVHFLTAMCRNEFRAYAPEVADFAFAELASEETQNVVQRLVHHGFKRVNDTLLVRDLGIVTRHELDESDEPSEQTGTLRLDDPAKDALQRAQAIADLVQTGLEPSRNQAARRLGYRKETAKSWCKLLRLDPEIQAEILYGAVPGLPIGRLQTIAALETKAQRAAFDELVARLRAGQLRKPTRQRRPAPAAGEEPPVRLRVVVYFNPEILRHRRDKAQQKLDELSTFVEALNAEATPSSTEAHLLTAVDRKLRRFSLLSAYDVSTYLADTAQGSVPQLRLQLREAEWKRRRALDGFSVLVAHPSLVGSAAELGQLYRGKDTVEKDFQTIKSVLRMLPVRHRTDDKVLAHVTICVLALLLERLLRDALKGLMSAEEALRVLEPSHLNRYGSTPHSRAYLVTELDSTQKKLLRTLNLEHLGDDELMIEAIHPK